MRASVRAVAVSLAVVLALPAALDAGVATEERVQVQLGGILGGIMSRFGGKGAKAAKEGLRTRVAVVGDRKLTLDEQSGQIVDLAEEAIYDLDVKERTYRVTTFAELKKRFEEQRAKAEKEMEKAKKDQKKDEKAEGAEQPEFEIDFDVRRTGQKRTIVGHEAVQTITRITIRQKGKSLQQAGGMVLLNDQWLAPEVAELREIEDFDRRYALKMAELYGFDAGAMKATGDQMASLVAAYPGLTQALEKMKTEGAQLEGTPLLATFSVNAIRSAAEVAKAEKDDQEITGVSGFLAKKLMKKAAGDPTEPRQILLSTTSEMLKITPDATAADVAMPAGYSPK
jgi:hypothetical protein